MGRNRGLVERVWCKLQKQTPYLLEMDEARIIEHIELAKLELGDRQKDKHDKWTKRVVDRTVARMRAGV